MIHLGICIIAILISFFLSDKPLRLLFSRHGAAPCRVRSASMSLERADAGRSQAFFRGDWGFMFSAVLLSASATKHALFRVLHFSSAHSNFGFKEGKKENKMV